MRGIFKILLTVLSVTGMTQANAKEQIFFEGFSYEEPSNIEEANVSVKDRFHDGRQVRWYIVRNIQDDKAARVDLMMYTLACAEPKQEMTKILAELLRENSYVSELKKTRVAKLDNYSFDFAYAGQPSKERLVVAGEPGRCIALKITSDQPYVDFDRASSNNGWLGSGIIPSLVQSIVSTITFHENH